MGDIITEILKGYGDPDKTDKDKIERELVDGWMSSTYLNVWGAICSMLLRKQFITRIEPHLTFNELKYFLLNY